MTNQNLLNWEDARYFLAVARAGKINAAAENLGISPITLSRRMAHLQDRLKTHLLTRHNMGVELTQDGQRMLEYLERAESEFDAATESFDPRTKSLQGTLRIAAPEGFGIKVLTPKISTLIAKHPALNIEIVPLPRGLSLSKREADIAIMVDKPQEPTLDHTHLTDYYLGLYAAPDYLAKFGTPASTSDLATHRLIGYVEDLLSSEHINTPRAAWPNWQSQIAVHSPIGQLEAVKSGAGIGVLHRFLIENDSALVPVLPEIAVRRSFYIVTHQNMRRLKRIEEAIAFLKSIKLG